MELMVLALLRASNYVLIAVGFALVFGSLRILNLMHGSFVMLGSYGAYFFIAALIEGMVAGPSHRARFNISSWPAGPLHGRFPFERRVPNAEVRP